MKLCIIVSNSLRKDPRVIKQIRCALDAEIDVYFIGFKDKFYNKEFLDSVGCHISIVDTYVGQLKSTLKKLIRKFHHFYLPVKYMIKIKPDIIHANDFDTLIQAYVASKIVGSKLLYDSHEVCAENIGITDKKIQKKVIIIIEKFIVERIDVMVSVSNAAAEYFREKYKIKILEVITNVPYKSKIEFPEEKDKDNFEVLYQGLMLRGRGYEEFVKSGEFIDSNIKLVLRGYGSIEDDLKNIILNNNLEKKVRFDGPVEVKDIVMKASCSHLGIVLTQPVNINFKLTVSNKIFEYLQAGLPVLMSDIPEHRYLNEKFNFGIIITDFTSKEIANAINSLALNRLEYNRLRNNAIKAAETLCWENESIKLIELYENMFFEKS
ncbi:glycosyltransferase family 4 protein [Lutimonas halocynthiae]|uniref:glycosyltransferase family 4 protein n=1 Tax=Lutimonas halocynthiae TaxID=1446477 RepID=UPI0025B457DA|nr:glycosyltransferase family 4 protein [Lutimonas halocynthiae]MDN3643788.1 glycosyltransferase family 4 protein [Lutimonas halocynthiae]